MSNIGCNSSIKQIKTSLNLWIVKLFFDSVSIFIYYQNY